MSEFVDVAKQQGSRLVHHKQCQRSTGAQCAREKWAAIESSRVNNESVDKQRRTRTIAAGLRQLITFIPHYFIKSAEAKSLHFK